MDREIICKVNGCENEARREGYCRIHLIDTLEKRYLDNTDPTNLKTGILAFGREVCTMITRQATPRHHIDIIKDMIVMFDPALRNADDRLLEIIAFREGAKTSLMNIVILYLIVFNNKMMKIKSGNQTVEVQIMEKLIIYLCASKDAAEDRISNIKSQLMDANFRWLFPISIKKIKESGETNWSKQVIYANGIYLAGKGWMQSVRGLLKNNWRITTLIPDDIYNEENIKTESQLNEVRKKWNNATKNSMDNGTGKIMWLCTLIHENTLSVSFKNSLNWTTHEYPIMDYEQFLIVIKEHLKVVDGNQLSMWYTEQDIPDKIQRSLANQRYYAELEKNNPQYKLRWKEKFNLYDILNKYTENYNTRDGKVKGFYQEYFHVLLPESSKRINKDMIVHVKEQYKIFKRGSRTMIDCKGIYDIPVPINMILGVDTSGSEKDSNDYTSIIPVGALPDGRIAVFPYFNGKTEMRDIYYGPMLRHDKIVMNRSDILTIGFIDEIIRMAIQWHVSTISLGVVGEENLFANEIFRILESNGLHNIEVFERKQNRAEGSKFERIINGVGPYYQSMRVLHMGEHYELEKQLINLGAVTYDDCADAEEVAFKNLEFPEFIPGENPLQGDPSFSEDFSLPAPGESGWTSATKPLLGFGHENLSPEQRKAMIQGYRNF